MSRDNHGRFNVLDQNRINLIKLGYPKEIYCYSVNLTIDVFSSDMQVVYVHDITMVELKEKKIRANAALNEISEIEGIE